MLDPNDDSHSFSRTTGEMSTNSTIPAFDISHIAGNAADSIKLKLRDIPGFLESPKHKFKNSFGRAIELRMKLTELSIISKAEEPNKLEGRAVLEVDVAEGILLLSFVIEGVCHYLIPWPLSLP